MLEKEPSRDIMLLVFATFLFCLYYYYFALPVWLISNLLTYTICFGIWIAIVMATCFRWGFNLKGKVGTIVILLMLVGFVGKIFSPLFETFFLAFPGAWVGISMYGGYILFKRFKNKQQ